jgi:NADPH:quinone reductase-like Zn-dependent oxidoreductase
MNSSRLQAFAWLAVAHAKSMQAVVATEATGAGDLSVVQFITKDVPKCGAEQVLIAVNASSINPVDWKIFDKTEGMSALIGFPHTLGFDVAGTVTEVGVLAGKRLKVGDEVWADLGKIWPLQRGELGAYAQFAVADEPQVGIKPAGLTFAQAAVMPLAAMTNIQALRKAGAPWSSPENRTVMVTSGSGGTGHLAVQMVKKGYNIGTVITVTSPENVPFCKASGADVVYDFTTQDAYSLIADSSVDVVYDNYGAAGTADKAMRILKEGGVFVYVPGKGGGDAKSPKTGVKQVAFSRFLSLSVAVCR